MTKVNWNLEEIEKFKGLTDEELVETSGGEVNWYDVAWWALSAGVGIVSAPAGVAVGLIPIIIDASTITAYAPTVC